jgi:hypothetical protein
MEKIAYQFDLNEYVKLRSEGQDSFYPFAMAGSPAWIRKQDHDDLGYPVVFVEWDKEHWSYNGEEDRWTMESHFEPIDPEEIEESEDMPENQLPEELANLFKQFLESQGVMPKSEDNEAPSSEAIDQKYETALDEGVEFAKSADAFIILAIKKEGNDPREMVFSPAVFNSYKDEVSGIFLESQVSRLGALGHVEAAHLLARAIFDKEDESGR